MREIKEHTYRLILSTKIAKQIVNEGIFTKDLVDIQRNKSGNGQSIFVFKESKEFNKYLLEKFNIK